jgi:hypothetical protein
VSAGTAAPERTAWVCPDPVDLTEDEITAALFAFSGLADECPAPSAFMVADELAGIVPAAGISVIRATTGLLRAKGLTGERMTRCRAAARLLLTAGGAA